MLGELLDAGASALKLEGRMKAPDYVYSIVDVYRRQLDDALASRTANEAEREARARQLKRAASIATSPPNTSTVLASRR